MNKLDLLRAYQLLSRGSDVDHVNMCVYATHGTVEFCAKSGCVRQSIRRENERAALDAAVESMRCEAMRQIEDARARVVRANEALALLAAHTNTAD